MKKFFIFLFLFSFAFSFFITSELNPAQAQFETLRQSGCLLVDYYDPLGGTLKYKNVATLDCLGVLVANVVYWALIMSGTIAVIIIIIAGIKFVTSGGDPKQAEGAKKTLIWAIVGLLLILLSFGIVSALSTITGVKSLTGFSIGGVRTCTNNSQCGEDQYCERKLGSPNFQQCVRISGYCTSKIQCDLGTRCDLNVNKCQVKFDYCCKKGENCKSGGIYDVKFKNKAQFPKYKNPNWIVRCKDYEFGKTGEELKKIQLRENVCDPNTKQCVRCLKDSDCTSGLLRNTCVKNPDDPRNTQRNRCCISSEFKLSECQ